MAKLNHKNLGEVQKTAYLTATITTVDGEFDTACFDGIGKCPAGTDIPIFYHCQYEEGEEPAQRDNGALEGASGAFSKDDEVIVQCEVLDSTTYKPLYIIGFTDKPKSCYWEPWGKEICDHNQWRVEYYDPWSEALCPVFPTGVWELLQSKGNYSLAGSLTISGETRVTCVRFDITDDQKKIPNLTDTPLLKIKISASCTPSTNMGTSVNMKISADEGPAFRIFTFDRALGPYTSGMWSEWVGDNEGEELTIDLSVSGFGGDLKSLALSIGAGEGDISTIDCDYITFSKA